MLLLECSSLLHPYSPTILQRPTHLYLKISLCSIPSLRPQDILLNVFLAIAVDNLADADALGDAEEEEAKEGEEVSNNQVVTKKPKRRGSGMLYITKA